MNRFPQVVYRCANREQTAIAVDLEKSPSQAQLARARMARIICGAIFGNKQCPDNCEIKQLLKENGYLAER
jgi:hypothetical protein